MNSIIFDFDSTIISCESLEVILDGTDEIHEITLKGLRGEISFEDSLNQRLAISAPTKEQVVCFGESASQYLTSGMEALVKKLISAGHEVWIYSGGIKESIVPLASDLGIPESRVQAVEIKWNEDGSFNRVIPPTQKHEFTPNHRRPAISVGDAMSDYLLYESNVVDDFILYTEHFRCDEIVAKGVKQARNVIELEELLHAKK